MCSDAVTDVSSRTRLRVVVEELLLRCPVFRGSPCLPLLAFTTTDKDRLSRRAHETLRAVTPRIKREQDARGPSAGARKDPFPVSLPVAAQVVNEALPRLHTSGRDILAELV